MSGTPPHNVLFKDKEWSSSELAVKLWRESWMNPAHRRKFLEHTKLWGFSGKR
jgi:hypothetical protein